MMQNKFRKCLSVALSAVMLAGVMCIAPVTTGAVKSAENQIAVTDNAEQAGLTYGDYEYKVLDDGTVEITEYKGSTANLTIASSIAGRRVTRIATEAFRGNANIANVVIPDSIKFLGYRAFADCSRLATLTIGSGVKELGTSWSDAQTFINCKSLRKVTIKSGANPIGVGSFAGCSSLISINIPSSVLTIGDSAFENCSALSAIAIPGSVKTIGNSAFAGCKSITSLSISYGVTSIGSNAFYNCSRIATVNIPDSVTFLGYRAFGDCLRLSTLTIGSKVKEIGTSWSNADTFINCSSLKKVTVKSGANPFGNRAFYGCKALQEINIPSTATSIGDSAFYGCSSLTSLKIPGSVKSIGASAYKGCKNISSVTFNYGLISIGSEAFTGLSRIKTIVIPDSVKSLGYKAFGDCTGLSTLTIGSGVNEIGTSWSDADTFINCTALQKVTIKNGADPIGNGAFSGCSSLNSINIPASVLSIGDSAFRDCISLKSISIPGNTLTIGDSAFENCKSLSALTMGKGVLSIGRQAFSKCISLTNVTIPDSVTSLGYKTFGDCSKLKAVIIGSGVIDIGTSWGDADTFINCTSLKAVTIKDGADPIGPRAFSGCSSLTTVIIPSSVLEIGNVQLNADNLKDEGVFYGCPKSLTIYGKTGSFAQQFARANGIYFKVYAKVSSVKLNTTSLSYPTGKSGTFKATISPSNASNKVLSWKSSNTKVATVDSNGKLTAKGVGTATITCAATDGSGKYATCKVTVYQGVTSIKLNTNKIIWPVGKSGTFKATVSPSNAVNKAVTWKSSNTRVATVDSKGKLTAKGVGKATITCTAKDGSGKYATCTVYVTPKTPTNLTVKKASATSAAISWSKQTGAKGYMIYRSTSKNGTYTKIKTTTSTKYTNTGLKKGKTYYYKVRAYVTIGNMNYLSPATSAKGIKL
ncbi:MAG: leucine-rich repeat protein [Acutalibacteraceae bacterium]